MLYIHFGKKQEVFRRPDCIGFPDDYYDMMVNPEWLTDNFSARLLEKVDHVTPIEGSALKGLLALYRSPREICTGSKNVLLCKHTDYCHMLIYMGPNCYPFLLEAAESKDIHVYATSYTKFSDECLRGRTISFPDIGKEASTFKEVVHCFLEGEGLRDD